MILTISKIKNKTSDPGYSGFRKNKLESLDCSYNIPNDITAINKDYALKIPGKYAKGETSLACASDMTTGMGRYTKPYMQKLNWDRLLIWKLMNRKGKFNGFVHIASFIIKLRLLRST